jgi:Lar family restriction alleviation protein
MNSELTNIDPLQISTASPCPFCGSNSLHFRQFDVEDREGFPILIRCNECGTDGPWAYCKDIEHPIEALVKWNKRSYLEDDPVMELSVVQVPSEFKRDILGDTDWKDAPHHILIQGRIYQLLGDET